MALNDLIRAVDELSHEEFEVLYAHVRNQHIQRIQTDVHGSPSVMDEHDRHVESVDVDELKRVLAELRAGFTDDDLDELEWAMNVEYIQPLDSGEE